MEIGKQRIDDAETITRRNKQIGVAAKRRQFAARCCGLQRTQTGGADGDHPPAARAAGRDRINHVLPHLQPFLVHDVLGKIFVAHRLERPRANVQRNLCHLHAAQADGGEQCLVKMQPGGGGGDRAAVFGKHRLIALLVALQRRALQIRRNRHLALRRQQLRPRRLARQGKQRLVPPRYLHLGITDANHPANLRRFRGAHIRIRLMRALQALQQNLDAAAAFLLPEQPRRQHARIVEHQQIIGLEQIRQIAHHAVGKRDLIH